MEASASRAFAKPKGARLFLPTALLISGASPFFAICPPATRPLRPYPYRIVVLVVLGDFLEGADVVVGACDLEDRISGA